MKVLIYKRKCYIFLCVGICIKERVEYGGDRLFREGVLYWLGG